MHYFRAKAVGDATGYGEELFFTTQDAPVVDAGLDAGVAEGGTFSQAGSFTDPGANIWEATVDYGDGGGSQALTHRQAPSTFRTSTRDNGTYAVTVTVTASDGGVGSGHCHCHRDQRGPVVSAGADTSVAEGSNARGRVLIDPGADTRGATVDYGDGGGSQALTLTGKTFNSHVYTDNGTYTVTVTVTDDDGGGLDTVTVTVTNVAPAVSAGADDTIPEQHFPRGQVLTDPGADTWGPLSTTVTVAVYKRSPSPARPSPSRTSTQITVPTP